MDDLLSNIPSKFIEDVEINGKTYKGIKIIPQLTSYKFQGNNEDFEEYVEIVINFFEKFKPGANNNHRYFIKWISGKRENAVGYIKKVLSFTRNKQRKSQHGYKRRYSMQYRATGKLQIGFNDRQNTAILNVGQHNADPFFLLLDYKGPSVWHKFDPKKQSEEDLKTFKFYDIRENEIKVNDVVSFLNDSVHYRLDIPRKVKQILDYGIVREIKFRYEFDYLKKRHRIPSIIVESITQKDRILDTPIKVEVTTPNFSILVITDTDLQEDAMLAKLQN